MRSRIQSLYYRFSHRGSLGAAQPSVVTRVWPYHGQISTGSLQYSSLLEGLVNWEQRGIPKAAGTGASEHFDLDRMRRLLDRLGRPQAAWPAVHVAGSKGAGLPKGDEANRRGGARAPAEPGSRQHRYGNWGMPTAEAGQPSLL